VFYLLINMEICEQRRTDGYNSLVPFARSNPSRSPGVWRLRELAPPSRRPIVAGAEPAREE
jgi:hypothetical protein